MELTYPLQGTSAQYVLKELQLQLKYFHGPDEFLIIGFYGIQYNLST